MKECLICWAVGVMLTGLACILTGSLLPASELGAASAATLVSFGTLLILAVAVALGGWASWPRLRR